MESAAQKTAVRYAADRGVARIRLAAPDSGNVLSRPLLKGLLEALEHAASQDGCRVVVLEAEGEDFCRGLDWKEVFDSPGEIDLGAARLFLRCLARICRSSRPVIARVEGNVTGGGVGLVAACDIVLARAGSDFLLPEALVGMFPALIAPFLLRRVPAASMQYLALSTRAIRAMRAQALGLVDEVVEGSREQMDRAEGAQVKRLMRSCPAALDECKRYIGELRGEDLERDCAVALERFADWVKRPEVLDGLRLFAEGLCPPWFGGQSE